MNGSTKLARSRAGCAAAPCASVTVSNSATLASLEQLDNFIKINICGQPGLPRHPSIRPVGTQLLPSPRYIADRTRADDKRLRRRRTIGRGGWPADAFELKSIRGVR